MRTNSRSESGQILVILVFVIFGLLGFTALAIDGGMIYSERRRAQNAADAGALAAALAKIESKNLYSAAVDRITSNGYASTWGPCSPAGYDCTFGSSELWTVEITNPPRIGDYAGHDEYIHVQITAEVEPAFVHLFFKDGLQTTVHAVSRVWPPQNIKPGYALYGATKTDCKGIWFSGTGDTTIGGGSVFSNSDANSKSCQSGVQDGNGKITIGPPPENIQVVGNFDIGKEELIEPLPIQEGVSQENLRPVPEPDCSLLSDFGKVSVNAGKSRTLDPGRYESISFKAGANLTLNPGMYCIYGSKGFTGNGGSITGTDVMIYLETGGLDLGGNSVVALAAADSPGELVDPEQNDWMGMLILLDSSNTSAVKITGSTGSTYTGTIYAASSSCTINGTGDNIGLLSTQIICDTIKITGTAQVDIQYDQGKVYSLPPAIDLAQ